MLSTCGLKCSTPKSKIFNFRNLQFLFVRLLKQSSTYLICLGFVCVCVYCSIPRPPLHTHTQNVSCNLRNIAVIIIQSIHKSPYPEISVWTSPTILNITRHNIWDAFVIICVHFSTEKRNAKNRLLRYKT